MSRILLFGGGLQTLSISRGLKDYGHIVVNVADKNAVGRYGRFIDFFYEIMLEDYRVQDFIQLLSKASVDLVIPTEDEYAEWLSEHKQEIEKLTAVRLAVADHTLFRSVINKKELLATCKKWNIPHPKTMAIDICNVDEIAKQMSFPVLIKPDISNGSRGIKRVENVQELKQILPEVMRAYGTCTAQEFINQQHYYNVMLYRYEDGSWGQYVVTKITRYYPIKGGSSSFCTTIINDEITKPCKTLLEKLGWYGFADFDVLEKGNGDYRIIEINPRVPASVHAAYISGVNFGAMLASDMLEGKKLKSDYKPGTQLRFLGLDIAWFLASPNRFKTSPSWFKFIGKNLYYQEGGIHDIKAMFYSILLGIRKELSPSFRKSKVGMN